MAVNIELLKCSLVMGILFFILSHPLLYRLLNRQLHTIVAFVDERMCPTESGVLIHAIIFVLVVYFGKILYDRHVKQDTNDNKKANKPPPTNQELIQQHNNESENVAKEMYNDHSNNSMPVQKSTEKDHNSTINEKNTIEDRPMERSMKTGENENLAMISDDEFNEIRNIHRERARVNSISLNGGDDTSDDSETDDSYESDSEESDSNDSDESNTEDDTRGLNINESIPKDNIETINVNQRENKLDMSNAFDNGLFVGKSIVEKKDSNCYADCPIS